MPESAYFDSVRIWALFDGLVYEEISNVVINGSIKGRWGIQSNSVLERMGGPERLEFDVRNDEFCALGEGWATPGGPNVHAGWGTGLRVLVGFTFDGWTKYFTAKIPVKGITPDPNPYGSTNVHVMALGWTNEFAQHKLDLIQYQTNQKLDQVAATILATMDVQPQQTDIRIGTRTFPAAFDTLRPGDAAMGELAKAVFSEFSYVYTKRDRVSGETFVVEARDTRNYSEPVPVEVPMASSGYLTTQAGAHIITQASAKIVVNEIEAGVFDLTVAPMLKSASAYLVDQSGNYINTQANERILANQRQLLLHENTMLLSSPEVVDGEGVINRAKFSVYPRHIQSPVVLYSITNPTLIAAGETKIIKGTYSDPNGKRNTVNAHQDTMSTVYAMHANSDGTGTDLLANLTRSAVYGSAEVEYTLTNTGAAGYFTIEASGEAVFIDDAIGSLAVDQTSIDAYGLGEDATIPMKYNVDPLYSQFEADLLIENYSLPRMKAKSFEFLANANEHNMLGFIFLDVGSAAFFQQDYMFIASPYFINGVEFSMQPGNILYYKYTVIEAFAVGYELPLSTWQDYIADLTGDALAEALAAQSTPAGIDEGDVHISPEIYRREAKRNAVPADQQATAAKKAVATAGRRGGALFT